MVQAQQMMLPTRRLVRWISERGISPNQITLGRLLFFVPGWLIWVYMHPLAARTGLPWQLFGSLALVLVTTVILFDIIDGELARQTGQVSNQGKVLDPLVDKFITYSTLVLFWQAISHVGLVSLFFLDLVSTFLRGVNVQGANEFGKKKALGQNLSKFFFGMAVLTGISRLNVVGNILIWTALAMASISVGVRVIPERAKNPIARLVPQLMTLCNLGCGVLAMVWAVRGEAEQGTLFLFAAMAFDLFDGAVARRLGVTSNFGKQFDSVADMVSFGIAPACLVASTAGFSAPSIGGGLLYAAATGLRLYDYGRNKAITPRGFFRGVPSPAGAWVVAAGVICAPYPVNFAVMLVAAGLMCSFRVNWQHFGAILPTMSVLELVLSIALGMIPAIFLKPLGFVAGPIFLYLLSPLWRKPS